MALLLKTFSGETEGRRDSAVNDYLNLSKDHIKVLRMNSYIEYRADTADERGYRIYSTTLLMEITYRITLGEEPTSRGTSLERDLPAYRLTRAERRKLMSWLKGTAQFKEMLENWGENEGEEHITKRHAIIRLANHLNTRLRNGIKFETI